MRKLFTLVAGAAVLSAGPVVAPAHAQAPVDLTKVSIEELLQMTVTSANKKEQPAEDVPAAVTVLTHDDIVRSGARTLPELLRLVPGMQVARINSSDWAIASRGFNDLLNDKLLVLVDGRSTYNRRFSGVFWDMEDMLLDDIDHIEVVRGAGGAVWGANAMNGVINIVTRSAKDTAGGFARAETTSIGGSRLAGRYGWSSRDVAMRLSTQLSEHGAAESAPGIKADDGWRNSSTAFRIDWSRGAHAVMGEASFVDNRVHPGWMQLTSIVPGADITTAGTGYRTDGSFLGRWTYATEKGSLQAQAFFTRRQLDDPITNEVETASDVDVQYRRAFGRHDVVVGGGYRDADDINAEPSETFRITPEHSEGGIASAFANDEFGIGSRLRASVGARLERDSVSGWSFQPSVRGIWLLDRAHQRVWGAVSRAARLPSLIDLGIRVNYLVLPPAQPGGLPMVLGFVGNPDYQSEHVVSTEGGYRFEFSQKASFDVSIFRNHYTHLKTSEPIAPVFEPAPGLPHLFIATQYENLLQADTRGVEVSARWMPSAIWRLDGSFTGFHLTPHLDPASQDPLAGQTQGQAPGRQWQAHSWLALGPRTEVNVALYRVGDVVAPGSGVAEMVTVPAYTRADANVSVRLSDRLSVTLAGQNLFDQSHAEFAGYGVETTLVPRTASVQAIWKF